MMIVRARANSTSAGLQPLDVPVETFKCSVAALGMTRATEAGRYGV